MAFKSKTEMDYKKEFVLFASQSGANVSQLCKRYGISRKTGYKWLSRYLSDGLNGLIEKSRRPNSSPLQIAISMEERIIELRKDNPEWGAKKIYKLLSNQELSTVPARSTINRVLKRKGFICKEKSIQAKAWKRFEYEYPNALWQMDFKGHFNLLDQVRCYPLTIMDDHSRYNLGLIACKDEKYVTVRHHLSNVFRRYGLPEMILADNGNPWGTAGNTEEGLRAYSTLEKWMMRLNVKLIHGRAYHPQTQGKEERFHRTLKAELLQYEEFKNIEHCQIKFSEWREKYNTYRPHEALNFELPVNKYKPSTRSYPETFPEIEYSSSDQVRKVMDGGLISFRSKVFRVGKAFTGEHIAIRPTIIDGKWDVYYCNQIIRNINLL